MDRKSPTTVEKEKGAAKEKVEANDQAGSKAGLSAKGKIGMAEVLSVCVGAILSWGIATAAVRLQLDALVSFEGTMIFDAISILAALGIVRQPKWKNEVRMRAALIAIGCVIGCSFAYFNFHYRIVSRAVPAPTQETAINVQTSAPSEEPTSSPPTVSVEPGPESEGDDGAGAIISKPVDPAAVTIAPDSVNLLSKNILREFCALIGPNVELPVPEAGNKSFWKASLEKNVWDLTNTNTHPNSDAVNRDPNHTRKTEAANARVEQMEKDGYTPEGVLEVIRLREEAYRIYPTAELRALLSSDYTRLGGFRQKDKMWEEAYSAYQEAVRYKILSIRLLMQPDDQYYYCNFELADLYHKIGDLDGLDTPSKNEAYYIAVCFEELASANLTKDQLEKQADSYYYAGMINQKLFSLNKENSDPEWVPYFLDACKYYKKSLDYDRNTSDKYAALGTLYEYGRKTTAKREVEGLLTSREYAELEKENKERR